MIKSFFFVMILFTSAYSCKRKDHKTSATITALSEFEQNLTHAINNTKLSVFNLTSEDMPSAFLSTFFLTNTTDINISATTQSSTASDLTEVNQKAKSRESLKLVVIGKSTISSNVKQENFNSSENQNFRDKKMLEMYRKLWRQKLAHKFLLMQNRSLKMTTKSTYSNQFEHPNNQQLNEKLQNYWKLWKNSKSSDYNIDFNSNANNQTQSVKLKILNKKMLKTKPNNKDIIKQQLKQFWEDWNPKPQPSNKKFIIEQVPATTFQTTYSTDEDKLKNLLIRFWENWSRNQTKVLNNAKRIPKTIKSVNVTDSNMTLTNESKLKNVLNHYWETWFYRRNTKNKVFKNDSFATNQHLLKLQNVKLSYPKTDKMNRFCINCSPPPTSATHNLDIEFQTLNIPLKGHHQSNYRNINALSKSRELKKNKHKSYSKQNGLMSDDVNHSPYLQPLTKHKPINGQIVNTKINRK